jgi:hypothetical protein
VDEHRPEFDFGAADDDDAGTSGMSDYLAMMLARTETPEYAELVRQLAAGQEPWLVDAEHHPDCPAGDGSMFCLCQALRAAEHRLWTSARGIARLKSAVDNDRDIGWSEAVGQMRDAVAAMEDVEPAIHEGEPQGLDSRWVLVRRADVLALLDGLPDREAPNTARIPSPSGDAASDTSEGTP